MLIARRVTNASILWKNLATVFFIMDRIVIGIYRVPRIIPASWQNFYVIPGLVAKIAKSAIQELPVRLIGVNGMSVF